MLQGLFLLGNTGMNWGPCMFKAQHSFHQHLPTILEFFAHVGWGVGRFLFVFACSRPPSDKIVFIESLDTVENQLRLPIWAPSGLCLHALLRSRTQCFLPRRQCLSLMVSLPLCVSPGFTHLHKNRSSIFVFVCLVLGLTHWCSGWFLALHSVLTPGSAWGPYEVPGKELGSAM